MDYIEAFRNLKTNKKYGRPTPHKAVMLLTVMEMYERGTLTKNVVKYDEALKSSFLSIWNKVLPGEMVFHPEAYLPFWYLQKDDFWHIVPNKGKEDILAQMRDEDIKPSESKILDQVHYAELDEDLFFLITLQSGRKQLRQTLLETYTNLSSDMVELLSESVDTVVDDSLSAVEEYRQILKGATDDGKSVCPNASSSNEKAFFDLDEEIQLSLRIHYYTFLKQHKEDRTELRAICPTEYDLYDKIVLRPLKRRELPISFINHYEEFLYELKMALLCDVNSFEFVDKLDVALRVLGEDTAIDAPYASPKGASSILDFDVLNGNDQDESYAINEEQKGKSSNDDEIERDMDLSDDNIRGFSTEMTEVSLKTKDDRLEQSESSNRLAQNEIPSFVIEKGVSTDYIYDHDGNQLTTTEGRFKFLRGNLYRFNVKPMCLTVKRMEFEGGRWEKRGKVLVAYELTDLFDATKRDDYIDLVEDLIEGAYFKDTKIKYDGRWYDYSGVMADRLSFDDKVCVSDREGIDQTRTVVGNPNRPLYSPGFSPSGRLGDLKEMDVSIKDYLWLMAVIDVLYYDKEADDFDFDMVACMAIANAWSLLSKEPQLRKNEPILIDGVNYLMEESRNGMEECLDWNTSKMRVFESIKDYPIAGAFEDAVEYIIEDAPFKLLGLWLKCPDKATLILYSKNFANNCLYSINIGKDSYLEINRKWKNYLIREHSNLIGYFTNDIIESLCV